MIHASNFSTFGNSRRAYFSGRWLVSDASRKQSGACSCFGKSTMGATLNMTLGDESELHGAGQFNSRAWVEASMAVPSNFFATARIEVGCSAKLYITPTDPCSRPTGRSGAYPLHDCWSDPGGVTPMTPESWRASARPVATTNASTKPTVSSHARTMLMGFLLD